MNFHTFAAKIPPAIFACLALLAGLVPARGSPGADAIYTQCWQSSLPENDGLAVSLEGGRVYVSHSGGSLDSVTRGGKMEWSAELGGSMASNVVAHGDQVYVVTSTTGEAPKSTLRSLSRETGVVRWTVPIGNSPSYFLADGGDSLMVMSSIGVVAAYEPGAGKVIWERTVESGFTAKPLFQRTEIITPTSDHRLISVSISGGMIKELGRIGRGVSSVMRSESGEVAIGDDRGSVAYFSGSAMPLWRFRTGGSVSSILSFGNRLFVASDDNFLYMLKASNGRVAWKRRLPSRPSMIVGLTSTTLLVTTPDENGGMIIDIGNGKPVARLGDAGSSPIIDSKAAADGALIVLTAGTVFGYSSRGCTTAENGDERAKPPTAVQKN